jgi:hypothetical protein
LPKAGQHHLGGNPGQLGHEILKLLHRLGVHEAAVSTMAGMAES